MTDQLVVIMLATSFLTFLAGWHLAVSSHNINRAKIVNRLQLAETQLQQFKQLADKDPQRAWTDLGTLYASLQIEAAINEVRKTVEQRQSRTRQN